MRGVTSKKLSLVFGAPTEKKRYPTIQRRRDGGGNGELYEKK